jgi:hypothetical protein
MSTIFIAFVTKEASTVAFVTEEDSRFPFCICFFVNFVRSIYSSIIDDSYALVLPWKRKNEFKGKANVLPTTEFGCSLIRFYLDMLLAV